MGSTASFVTIAGLKNSGKTTVAEALIGELVRRGLRVASVKSMMHGSFRLEPEGTDTRRHLAAGAEATVVFSAEEDAVFAPRSPSGQLERLEHWLPSGLDWVVCEGQLADLPASRVILCLARIRDFAEALAVRGLDPGAVVAASGLAASEAAASGAATSGAATSRAATSGAALAALASATFLPGAAAGTPAEPAAGPLPVPLLDARNPRELARLVDLILGLPPR